jgi:hypothetical protein
MTIGMKISKPGYDVKTCTDDQLIMSSEFKMYSVALQGVSTGTIISHGLGYTPAFMASNSDGTYGSFVGEINNNPFEIGLGADSINFYPPDSGGKYYIFYQPSDI